MRFLVFALYGFASLLCLPGTLLLLSALFGTPYWINVLVGKGDLLPEQNQTPKQDRLAVGKTGLALTVASVLVAAVAYTLNRW